MSYLLAVAVVAGAPHAPAAYKAVERPILLARLQGEWAVYLTQTEPFECIYRHRIVFRGSLIYNYDPMEINGTVPAIHFETVWRIESISPTNLRAVVIRRHGKPVREGQQHTFAYSFQDDTILYGLSHMQAFQRFQRVPPGR
jgi:hypothetical protein